MSKIIFSVIGFGNIGMRHCEHIRNMAQLNAICDNDFKKLDKAKELFPDAKLFTSIDEFLENDIESDVVSICTPNYLHSEHTIKCLKAKKNVLCEKPMALTTNECHKMIEESLLAGKHLFIIKQNRYNPPVQKIKEILNKNLLGNIFSVQLNCYWNRNKDYYINSDWKGKKSMDGGILYTQFSHFLDLMLWFFGSVSDVFSFCSNYNHKDIIDFEDTLVSVVKFETGIIGTMNFCINSYNKNFEGSITIFGEKGTVKIGGQYLNILEYQNIENQNIEIEDFKDKPNNYGYYQGSMSNHDKVIENVLDVLENNGKIHVNALDGYRTVELIQKIYQNIK